MFLDHVGKILNSSLFFTQGWHRQVVRPSVSWALQRLKTCRATGPFLNFLFLLHCTDRIFRGTHYELPLWMGVSTHSWNTWLHRLLLEIFGWVVFCKFLRLRQVDSSLLVLVSFLRALQDPTSLRPTPRIWTRMLTHQKVVELFCCDSTSFCLVRCRLCAICPYQWSLWFIFVFWWEVTRIFLIITHRGDCRSPQAIPTYAGPCSRQGPLPLNTPQPRSATTLWLLILFFLWKPYVTRYNWHQTRTHKTVMILSVLDRFWQRGQEDMMTTRIVSVRSLFRH